MPRPLSSASVLAFLALGACKGPEDPSAGRPELAWDEAVLEMGSVPLGEVAEATFAVRNVGGGEIDVLSVVVADGDPDVWRVAWERVPLAGGDSLEVLVSFTPEQPDVREGARIQVRADVDGLESFYVLANGEGAPSNADEDGDGYTVAEGDCDDGDPLQNPGADERCNGADDDCDGAPDADEVDGDGDGSRLCNQDCDDTNSSVYPGAPEICDGLDSNCDGVNQDSADADGDGVSVCDGDCDDTSAAALPGGTEVCADGVDNDCDGTVDVIDADGDGHDVCTQAGDCDDADPAAFPRVVRTTGSPGAVGSAGDPLSDVAEAFATVDAVCRTIIVHPGTYPVSGLVWAAGDVSVISRGTVASDVVFDAGGAGRILDVTGGAVELRRITLANGVAPTGEGGGALRVAAGAQVTAQECAFDQNSSDADGGAARVEGTLAITSGATFTGNSAVNGGALAVSGSLVDPGLSQYIGNSATGRGGALHADGTVLVTGAGFEGNTAADGGAIALAGGTGHTIQRGRMWSNAASGDGGALWIGGGASALVRNPRIQDNTAASGGGVWIGEAAVVTLANSTLTANQATGEGAAILVDSDGATVLGNLAHFHDGLSGIWVTPASLAVATHNTAFGTSSGTDLGGALVVGVDENLSENPVFVAFTDDGDPSNENLALQPGSPAIDTGPPGLLDPDGSANDRGHTGGPGANP